MDEEELARITALTKNAMQLSARAIDSLVAKSKRDEARLRSSLDLMHQTRALASEDPIVEHLAVTMMRAALDRVHADSLTSGKDTAG
jgi:hypothetical protein